MPIRKIAKDVSETRLRADSYAPAAQREARLSPWLARGTLDCMASKKRAKRTSRSSRKPRTSKHTSRRAGDTRSTAMTRTPIRHTTREKLEALKRGRELPVDPRALGTPGQTPGTDERAFRTLAREYQRKEDPDYVSISWANQEKAAGYFNVHGLAKTLDEIVRVGGPEALQSGDYRKPKKRAARSRSRRSRKS